MIRQFDVFLSPAPMQRIYPYLIILQHDSVISTGDVIVAPLVLPSTMASARINPLLTVLGQAVILQTANLLAVPRIRLKEPVTNLFDNRARIIAAIDMLFVGS